MKTIDLRELEKLNMLRIRISRSLSQSEGDRRSSAKGRSAEFSGYREYIPGDDMRYVDWNAYARFDKLYIKEYMEEREGRVNIYLDTSQSMNYGEKLKSTLMAELTEVISYIAAAGRDSVYITDLSSEVTYHIPNGSSAVPTLRKILEQIEPQGSIDLSEALRKCIQGRGGVAYIMSDLMDEHLLENLESILRMFAYSNISVTFLHILSREELEVDEAGAYQLIDSEDDSREVKLTIDRQTVDGYKRALNDYISSIRAKTDAHGAGYILCSTGDSLQKIIFEDMRRLFI